MNNNFRKQFSLYFVIYGIIISFICILLTYYFQTEGIKKDFKKDAKEVFEIKIESILKTQMDNIDNIVKVLKKNKATIDYLENTNKTTIDELQHVFHATAASNKIIMQARIIDKYGNEVVKIDRNKKNNEAYIVKDEDLQNKSQREYFKILSNLKENTIWHSKFDLNVENEEIEIPFRPTLRVGIPLFKNDTFKGIIIINLSTIDLFNSIRTSTAFEHFILDKDHNFILHPKDEFSFNKYKNISRNFKTDFPDGLISNSIYIYPLDTILKNEDNALFALKIKKDYQADILKEKLNIAVIVLLLTLIISFFMAMIVSRIPIKLQNSLFEANEKLETSRILDKYIISATTKIDGTILEVSSAFAKSSGYSKDELIGSLMNIIKHPNRDVQIIKDLWDTTLKGDIWIGEIKNKRKNGEIFWLEQHIIPKFDSSNKIEKFVSLGIDITAKKELEKLASIDKLTDIYNRRMIDEFLQIEVDIAKRYIKDLSIIMLDLDHFKEVNDEFGHISGDRVLREVCKIITTNLRKSDIFGRYGGEEFLIICTETNNDSTFILAEKLRKAIEKYNFEEIGQKTISLGIASLEDNDSIKSLVEKADKALYKAKNTGRNKTIIYNKKI